MNTLTMVDVCLTKIDGFETMSQVQLWIIVRAGALKPSAPVRYGRANQIAENGLIKMEFKRHAVAEAQIFCEQGAAMYHACAESYRLRAASPDEEAHPVRHCGSDAAEIPLGQL